MDEKDRQSKRTSVLRIKNCDGKEVYVKMIVILFCYCIFKKHS